MKKPHKYPKRDNPKAKAAELQQSWDALLAKYSKSMSGRPLKPVQSKIKQSPLPNRGSQNRIPSSPDSMKGFAAKAAPKVYTGSNIVGIAVMHKSNLVPIFSNEAAIEVAQMRRN